MPVCLRGALRDAGRLRRPALHAALELGTDTFWDAVDAGITAGLDDFSQFLQEVVLAVDDRDVAVLARSLRRVFFAALLDKSARPDVLRGELWALIEPFAPRLGAGPNRPQEGLAP